MDVHQREAMARKNAPVAMDAEREIREQRPFRLPSSGSGPSTSTGVNSDGGPRCTHDRDARRFCSA